MKLPFMVVCFLCCANFWWSCSSQAETSSALPQSRTNEETWWWTLLTDPQVVAAIITVIGPVIATYQCYPWLKKNFKVVVTVLLACCGLIVLLLCIVPPFLSSSQITSYAQYLKGRYQEPLPDDEKLLESIGKIYIELAVIRNENISREEAENLVKLNIHGQTDKILLKRPSIALEDILKPGEDGKPIRHVLVEGAPGAGKSRLAWELCRKWAQGKLDSVNHYKLVVLVQLRSKRAQEAKVLRDLFPLSNNHNIEQVIDAIGNGDGVLIILEGFDELPDEQRKKGSVYFNLIERKELLPEATVIITSRPSVSAHLMKSPDRQLEILGFTEAKIEAFVRSVNFKDSKMRDDFLEYINGNPFIKEMMYLPLNAVFVTNIFELHHRSNLPYPKTMTQLYDAITRSLIRRHLVNKKLVQYDEYMPIQSLQCMEDIKRLPGPLPNQLLELARIAYEGLLNEQYVFTDPGFGNELFDNLGMMKKIVSLDDPATGPKFTFTFLHLTLQEYLSALHMSLASSTQMYDALVRRHIRRHMVYKKLVPADYHMLQTLQGIEYVNSLPHGVGDQLLLLAQVAYEGVLKNEYEFTNLANGNEFIHFGMMKYKDYPSTSTNPNPTLYILTVLDSILANVLVFLHPTLQEYLSALYKSLTNEGNIPDALRWHSDLGLPLPPNSEEIVSRFLAGLCKHSNSFSCQLVGDYLAVTCHLQLIRCVYETDSIVQKSKKLQERFSRSMINVGSESPFDYYLVGHCICHHSGMWSIRSYKEEHIKHLVKGLISCDDIPKGKLLELFISKVDLLELDPLLVSNLQHLILSQVTFTANSVNIIHKHILSGGALREVDVIDCEHTELLFPIVFESSFMDKIYINNAVISLHINNDALNLMMNNSNLKYLTLLFPLKLPAHTVCHNASLDFLAKLLLVFISYKHTIPKIEISHESNKFDVFFYFVKTSAGNREPEAKLTLTIHNSCYYDVTQQILAHIPEQYHIPVHIVAHYVCNNMYGCFYAHLSS